MTNQELIDKAYRDYPNGTKFKSIHSDNGIIREVSDYYGKGKKQNYQCLGGEIYSHDGMKCGILTCSNPRLYSNGVWCPIIGKEVINEYELY